MSPSIDVVCSDCGSRNVRRDAYAAWNTQMQEWELLSVFDQGYCEQCGGEARLTDILIISEAGNQED